MKKFTGTSRPKLSPIFLIAVIASLCFSVGEGLRLAPFPVTAVHAEEPTDLLSAKTSNATPAYRAGSVDVPTQTQKRSKRQSVDFACPSSGVAREPNTLPGSSSEQESVRVNSLFSQSRPSGRAPPFIL